MGCNAWAAVCDPMLEQQHPSKLGHNVFVLQNASQLSWLLTQSSRSWPRLLQQLVLTVIIYNPKHRPNAQSTRDKRNISNKTPAPCVALLCAKGIIMVIRGFVLLPPSPRVPPSLFLVVVKQCRLEAPRAPQTGEEKKTKTVKTVSPERLTHAQTTQHEPRKKPLPTITP